MIFDEEKLIFFQKKKIKSCKIAFWAYNSSPIKYSISVLHLVSRESLKNNSPSLKIIQNFNLLICFFHSLSSFWIWLLLTFWQPVLPVMCKVSRRSHLDTSDVALYTFGVEFCREKIEISAWNGILFSLIASSDNPIFVPLDYHTKVGRRKDLKYQIL